MEIISVEKPEMQQSKKLTQQQIFAQRHEWQQKRLNIPVKQKKRPVIGVIAAVFLIVVLSCAGFFGWYYWWTTQATFDFNIQPLVILEGHKIGPDDFLVPGENSDRISVVYRNPIFKPSIGYQDVHLTLTMGWRVVETTTYLSIMTPVKQIRHEFASIGPELKPIDFLENASSSAGVPFDIHFVEEPKKLEDYPVGEHIIKLSLNGTQFEVQLTVEDTIPPEAEPVNLAIRIGRIVRPEEFIRNISDASDHLPMFISYYDTEPDIFGHDQIITIKVEDFYGNYSLVHAGLTVQHNKEPPVIEGTGTILSYIGDPILYMRGVTARDDFGRDLTEVVVVDSSGVNRNEVGTYTVRYSVVDFTGLSFEVEETVYVLDIDIDFVYAEVDKALASIIKDDMSQLEQVYAIFRWVRSNVSYAITRDRPETVYEGAYRAIRERRGNCFIFYSISEMMLTQAGIPNMMIERIPGTITAHRWNLVNPDELGWHHYDSFPARLNEGILMAFFTDSQAEAFTEQIANFVERPADDYYTYDPSRYPEIVQ